MIKIAICDDNSAILHKMEEIISDGFSEHTDQFEIKTFSNGTTMLNEHNFEPFDIVFLDIDMPKMSGFDVAESLREEFSNCLIIFVTSHSHLVYKSMDFQPFHFICKDYEISLENSTHSVIKKIMKHMKQNNKVILEDDISGRCAVLIRDIIYIESDGHYVKYHVVKKEYPIKVRDTMKECEEHYQKYDFVRIHKRYLINLRYLALFNSKYDEILLREINQKLPMSKNYKNIVDEKYTTYLRSTV